MPVLPIPVPMIQSGPMPEDVRAWRTEQDGMMRGEPSPLPAERLMALAAERIVVLEAARLKGRAASGTRSPATRRARRWPGWRDRGSPCARCPRARGR